MKIKGPFPERLSFLNDLVDAEINQYQDATWLHSNYQDPVWTCKFDKTIVIDFRVRLEDSSLLTAPKNVVLLQSLKSWLCIQGHPSSNGYRIQAPTTTCNSVITVLHVIDYFLLNSERLGLATYGLDALTSDDIKEFLYALSVQPSIDIAIYRWDQRLTNFLNKNAATLTDKEVSFHLTANPYFSQIRDDYEPILLLDKKQLVRARIYLWRHGFYDSSRPEESNYRFVPNTAALSRELYAGTLWGCAPSRVPEELCFGWRQSYGHEFDRVPVRNREGEFRTKANFTKYLTAIRSLGLLSSTNSPVPHWALKVTADKAFLQSLAKRNPGRYKTLPYEVVTKSLRNSIEFILNYGKDLVESYLNLVRAAIESGSSRLTDFCTNKDLSTFLTPTVRNMGVRCWGLNFHMHSVESEHAKWPMKPAPPASDFFLRFRSNQGLYELLEVLYGAIQVCVGTIMGRRQGELNDLGARDSLDISRSYLIFENRKTGAYGRRVLTARPIPNIGAEAIALILRLQDGLIELGAIGIHGKIFAMPNERYLNLRTTIDSNTYLDRFCDYFELPLNETGQRYYLRQHQLRRNFAMMFFWGASFGGIETLQWFLGQADPEQLYNYITEEMPGSVLTSVKAAHAAYLLVQESPEVCALSDIVKDHFGTRNFSILDYEELQEYIADLLTEEKVTVEPQFFKVGNNKQYRILVLVKEFQ